MRATTVEEYRSSKAELGLVWLVYAVGAVAVLALVAQPELVAAAALAAVVALAAFRLPESLLVVFLVVGPVKDTELGARLVAVLPGGVDLTLLAAAGVVAALAASVWVHRREELAAPRPAFFFLALVVLLLVGVLASPDPAGGLTKALTFQFLSGLAFIAPLLVVRTPRSLYRLLALLVPIGVVVALSTERSTHASVLVLPGSDNQIQVGLLLGLGAVAITAYLWQASPGWLRLVWLPPAVVLVATLVSTGARSALLGTMLAATLSTVLLFARGGRSRIAALALVGVLVALLPAAWVSTDPAVKARYATTVTDARGGAGLDSGGAERSELAAAAVDVFATHPLGAGTGAYEALTGYEWPHNIILELASELGVLGVGTFLGLLAGTALCLRRALRRPGVHGEAVAATALLVLPLTMSLSSFDLNGNRVLWFACGLALAVERMGERGDM